MVIFLTHFPEESLLGKAFCTSALKKRSECLDYIAESPIFAPLFNRKPMCLDYGVMVAQQVLVLFVQVRILVVQPEKGGDAASAAFPPFVLYPYVYV